jgi:hypothetical protein
MHVVVRDAAHLPLIPLIPFIPLLSSLTPYDIFIIYHLSSSLVAPHYRHNISYHHPSDLLSPPPTHMLISVVLLNVALFRAESQVYVWTNGHFLMFLLISYEIERYSLQVRGSEH